MKNYWLMKTEPDVFSFEDLLCSPKQSTSWEGVRNYQARNMMRDQFKKGDHVFIYHSNTEDPAIIGIAQVIREGYADNTALDPKNKYFDEDCYKKGNNPWIMVDVQAIKKFKNPVTRSLLKDNKLLKDMMVLQKGSRLSVQPVDEKHFNIVCEMGKPESV